MKMVFIRHGETPGNERKAYIGRTDEHLSEKGRLALINDRETKAYPDPDLLYVSPMLRTRETCEILYPGKERTEVRDLRETDFGDFEGLNYQELESDPRYIKWMASGGMEAFPNGEGMRQMQARCVRAFTEIVESDKVRILAETKPDSTVVFVVHGGTIMALFSALGSEQKEYYEYYSANGNGYTADYEDGKLINCRRLFE